MPEKISVSKDWTGDIEFDTYIPTVAEAASIQDALKLFYFGSALDGEENVSLDSIYSHLVALQEIAAPVANELNNHKAASTDVHGLLNAGPGGTSGGAVVGTTADQILTNKTLTAPYLTGPKVNENVPVTVTSTKINYVNDVTSPIQAQINDIITNLIPQGTVVPFAGSTAPSNWLICDGRAVSRTTYSALFNAIGILYGAGNGSTTFNLPDLRGRTIAGLDNMGGTDAGRLDWANTIGTSGGAQTHSLTQSEMPSHRHFTTIAGDNLNYGLAALQGSAGGNQTNIYTRFVGGTGEQDTNTQQPTAPHNNMQPTILLNYIIKH